MIKLIRYRKRGWYHGRRVTRSMLGTWVDDLCWPSADLLWTDVYCGPDA